MSTLHSIFIALNIVLCDSTGKYYVAKDIYVLFAFLMSKCESED